MASIFGRRQKPTPTKADNRVSNVNPKGVDALMTGIVEDNNTNGVNGESDYHKNGRHSSSTFKPQIPPPTSCLTKSSSPTNVKDTIVPSKATKRYDLGQHSI